MDIKFLTQENEIQKLYSKFGLVVPVGDLSNTKAPAVSVNNITILDEPFYYPEDTVPVSQRTAEFELNVLTGAPEYNIVMCAYPKSVIDNCSEFQDGVVPTDFDLDDAINNPDSQSCLHTANAAIWATPSQRGYNHYKAPFYDGSDYGEYILIVSSYSDTEPYPFYTTTYLFNYEAPANWATPDEVLLGNKYIGEDGQEAVGTYVPEEVPDGLSYLGIPVFEYSVSEDPDTGENVIDYARLVEGSHANASEWAAAGLGAIDSYQIWYKWTTNDGQGGIDGTLHDVHTFDSIDNPDATYVDLSSVLNADALASGTYFLEAYEIIRYNGVEYATECITYPEDVYEGGPVIESGQLEITENGEGIDVTGYDSVLVDVPTGPTNYLELQLGDPSPWEDAWQNKYPFGGYLTLNLNDLTIPEGGTYSGNTPQDWVSDMEFIQCYLDAQHNDFFMVDCTSYNGMLNAPRSLGNAFITSNGTVIIPCIGGSYDPDPDTGEQTVPNYTNIPCGQTDLTGDFEVYAVTGFDGTMMPMYEVVATGTYFIPATQSC